MPRYILAHVPCMDPRRCCQGALWPPFSLLYKLLGAWNTPLSPHTYVPRTLMTNFTRRGWQETPQPKPFPWPTHVNLSQYQSLTLLLFSLFLMISWVHRPKKGENKCLAQSIHYRDILIPTALWWPPWAPWWETKFSSFEEEYMYLDLLFLEWKWFLVLLHTTLFN